MSGTSLDGLDACLVEVEGVGERLRWEVQATQSLALPESLRGELERAVRGQPMPAADWARLNADFSRQLVLAVEACVGSAGLPLAALDLVASHGQTIWHAPSAGSPFTWQLGHGAVLAALTGVTTVSDFRVADVCLGGQGAPLVPYVDRLLASHPRALRPGGAVFLNLGGIANITWVPPQGAEASLLACDTGPANMVLDALVQHLSGGARRFDEDGRGAAEGRVHEALLARWLARDAFLALPPPKSTGREHYGATFLAGLLSDAAQEGLGEADLLATVTAYTAESVAEAVRRHVPAQLADLGVFVSGGGAANRTLLSMLRQRLAPASLDSVAVLGVDPDFKEAWAFALLAYQTVAGEPNVVPAATGAREPWVLGVVAPGRNYRRLILGPTLPIGVTGVATESVNPASRGLDTLNAREAVAVMHAQDWDAVRAVGEATPAIAALVDSTVAAMRAGGRLFYVGAGTSGRLGVLDASECPPTFSTPPEWVQAVMAGGDIALRQAVEGAEDDARAGAQDLRDRGLRAGDVVVGISANGGAPYVRGALELARTCGAVAALLTCNPQPAAGAELDHLVVIPTGPEIVAGSTRLKAGTATKLVLNMLSTLTMVALGKVYDNLMVDVTISNQKLRKRAELLVVRLTGLTSEAAAVLLDAAAGRVKRAVVMHHQNVDADGADACLARSGGRLRPWMPAEALA